MATETHQNQQGVEGDGLDVPGVIGAYFEDYKLARELCLYAIESQEEKNMFEDLLGTLQSTEKVIEEWDNLPEKT